MRRRLTNRVTTVLAIGCAALLVSGCEAQVWGTPPSAENTPQAPVAAAGPAARTAGPAAPPASPRPPFDGLDARVQQATADAAESGADIETVVLDRNTGQTVPTGTTSPSRSRRW